VGDITGEGTDTGVSVSRTGIAGRSRGRAEKMMGIAGGSAEEVGLRIGRTTPGIIGFARPLG
jgi:hypothetical protein